MTSRVRGKWGRVLVQVGLDQTFGAAMVNSGYFAVHTLFSAALTGQAFPLPVLWSSMQFKVLYYYFEVQFSFYFDVKSSARASSTGTGARDG